MFVPGKACEKDLCKIIGAERCDKLTEKQTIPIDQIYEGHLPLPATKSTFVEGQWKIELSITRNGEVLSRARVADEWIHVNVEEQLDTKEPEKEQEEERKEL